MSDTTQTSHRLSGGEAVPSPTFQRLEALIEAEADVFHLHGLFQRPEGDFVYFIQTPFATHPKYVVGITDADNTSPHPVLLCGAQWSAESAYQNLINPSKP